MKYPIALHEKFAAALEDPSIAVDYDPIFRWFSPTWVEPNLVPYGAEIAETSVGGFPMRCCPWTGGALPRHLSGERYRVLLHEYGLNTDKPQDREQVPEEFRSDEWWRKRLSCNPEWDVNYDLYDGDVEMWPPYLEDGEVYVPWIDPSCPGRTRFPEYPPHMCADLQIFEGPRTLYAYLPWTREYGFRIIDIHEPVEHQPMRVCAVVYCPYCGRRLPSNLREEWIARVKALGLTPADTTPAERAALPRDLVSDTWWKEAGL